MSPLFGDIFPFYFFSIYVCHHLKLRHASRKQQPTEKKSLQVPSRPAAPSSHQNSPNSRPQTPVLHTPGGAALGRKRQAPGSIFKRAQRAGRAIYPSGAFLRCGSTDTQRSSRLCTGLAPNAAARLQRLRRANRDNPLTKQGGPQLKLNS